MATSTIRVRPLFIQHASGARPVAMRLALASAIGLVAGAVFGVLLPRGPITTQHAVLTIVLGTATGIAAASVSRSRWSVLLAPVAFVFAFEFVRRAFVSGPTIDSFRLDTLYGVLAFVLGRIVLVIAGVVPMMLGATIVLAGRRPVTLLPIVAIAALGISAVLPASTPPIENNGEPIPSSIASLERVAIGGREQWIMMRGHDVDKPVLLYLSGGPGQSDLPFVRVLFANLESDFVVVGWDQRGTGKSYPALDPTSTLTLDQAITDTIELTDYLRTRFDEPKIYVVGESWGTILGTLAVQRRPDLYYALIGSGQMVSVRETDRRLYDQVLELAEQTGDTGLAQTMHGFGQPPYSDVFANAVVMQHYDQLEKPYTPPESLQRLAASAARETGPWGVLGREYNLVEKVSVLRGLMDMFAVMYPQLQDVDLRTVAPRLEVPYYMLDGAAELSARRDLAHAWYAQLDAPTKRIFTFENSAHSVAQEQFVAFREILLDTIVPETPSQWTSRTN